MPKLARNMRVLLKLKYGKCSKTSTETNAQNGIRSTVILLQKKKQITETNAQIGLKYVNAVEIDKW